jgi:hypothetical protein
MSERTELQKKYYEKNKKLEKVVKDFKEGHRKLEEKRKNVIIPLQMEVQDLLVRVHGERKSNYNIISK